MDTLKVAVRNLGGAYYPGNRYRTRELQAAALADAIGTGAGVLLLQEVTGCGSPFEAPPGWQFHQPYSRADRGAASVVMAADGVAVDLTWQPPHPLLEAYAAYLDFGMLLEPPGPIMLASVHATRWFENTWAATGRPEPMPEGSQRPWPSDAILDALIEVTGGHSAILAGDWNEDPDYPRPGDPGAAAFQQRAVDAGLVEAIGHTFGGRVRTNFSARTKAAYQNDRVFLTSDLAERLRSVAVWHEPGARLSDHAGVLITLGS
jgi:hypothetical protein